MTRSVQFALLLALTSAPPLLSQDSLRVLRVQPTSAASPIEPVVIAFDHPVAPRLDLSVDPATVVQVTPRVRIRPFWRDPSTLVVPFDVAWKPGAAYSVVVNPALRGEGHLRLAATAPISIVVRMPRVLAARASRAALADTAVDPRVVFDNTVELSQLEGRAWIRFWQNCGRSDSVAMHPVRIDPVRDSDAATFRSSRDPDQVRWPDSLRRVVTFRVRETLPRGCEAQIRLPQMVGAEPIFVTSFKVKPPLRVTSLRCGPQGSCLPNPIVLTFSRPVSEDEVRRNVQVNGHAARTSSSGPQEFVLRDSVVPRQTTTVTVSGALRDKEGDVLGRDTTVFIGGLPLPPSVGYTSGPVLEPRDATTLLRVRHINTDSVLVVVGRIPDSLHIFALAYRDDGWYTALRWSQAVSDTVFRVFSTRELPDSEGIIDIPASLIPPEWRGDPMVLVRAAPCEEELARARDAKRVISQPTLPGAPQTVLEPRIAVVQRTDLALHAIRTGNEVAAWVTSVRDAVPRAGVEVRVLDDSLHPHGVAVTDARGRATVALDERRDRGAFLLVAQDMGDRAKLLLVNDPYGFAYDRGASARRGPRLNGHALRATSFAERGIYRPGERVFLSAAVRTVDGNEFGTPVGDSVKWTVRAASGRSTDLLWVDSTSTLGDFGVTRDSLLLPRSAGIGEYAAALSVRTNGAWQQVSSLSFTVAEYRAPEFAVTIDSVIATVFAGDTAHFRMSARYLFGQPMSNASVSWSQYNQSLYRWQLHPRGLDGYTVGTEAIDTVPVPFEGELAARTSSDGALSLAVPSSRARYPRLLEVVATFSDANRQTVVARGAVTVHSANAYIGLRSADQRLVLTSRDSLVLESKVVDARGAARIGDSVSFAVQRSRFINAVTRIDTVARFTRRSSASPETIVVRLPSPGVYRVIATVRDEDKREAVTDLPVWVAGPGAVWAQRSPRALSLRLGQPAYSAGDTASVFVESPVEQRAWVMLRHEGIRSDRVVMLLRGVNEVRLPVPVGTSPASEIRVMGAEPYRDGAEDSTGVYFRTGSETVAITEPALALHVAMRPERTAYQPRDTVRLDIAVTNSAGAGVPAAVTVWAVDEGVINLTGYRRPDVLAGLLIGSDLVVAGSNLTSTMLAKPPALRTAFVQANYFSVVGGSARAIRLRGASSGVALSEIVTPASPVAEDARVMFHTTAYFGATTTGTDGKALVAFSLPDNVTTFHLYAAAVGNGMHAGAGDTSIISTLPFVVRAALPRVVRAGDSLLAGAVLSQKAPGTTPVALSISARNADVLGATQVRGRLVAEQPLELRFPLRITGNDSVSFRLAGSTGGTAPHADAVAITLPVSPPGRARAWVISGLLTGAATASLAIPAGTDTLRSYVNVQLGTSVLAYVQSLASALRAYPYECTEQLASAGQAFLSRFALQRSLGDTAALTSGDRATLETIGGAIVNRQRSDGGFGYWGADNWSTPWLTAHAVRYLLSARDAGINVPAEPIARAAAYLRNQVGFITRVHETTDAWKARRDSLLFGHEAASAALMLRQAGAADTALERELWKSRTLLGFEDRLVFAQTLLLRADTAQSRELLASAWRQARVEGRRVTLDDSAESRTWLFRSVTRPYALLLATTAMAEPQHPQLGALMESVVVAGQSERSRWWNTLDQTLVADALSVAARAMRVAEPREIELSGPRTTLARRTLEPAHVDSVRLTVPALSTRVDGAASLQLHLTSASAAPTYYAMTLFEIPSARPVRADEAGIAVEHWYENYATGKPVAEVREGDLVRVRIRITVPTDREFVVVDDPLPAGLEAVDLSLRTSPSLPPFEGAPRLASEMNESPPGQRWLYGSWDAGWWTPWEHKEIHDDRVLYFARQLWKGSYQASYVARATTVGSFVRPPAQAEEMYNPAVRGRSDGGRFTVTRAP